jgi:hypothetical protein
MFVVVEIFISEIVDEHGKHPVSAEWDDACLVPLQACKFLKLKHHIHSFVYKNDKSRY